MHYADNIFSSREKMSSKQSVEMHIPKLDGSNFQVWSRKMQAYLRSQGLWNMVRGMQQNPPELGKGSKPDAIALRKKEKIEWSNCDEQVIGIIQLQLIDNLYDKVGLTSYQTWKNLEEAFGTPGLAIIHADFKKAINFTLSGSNFAPEIANLYTLFAQLKANKAELPEFHQVMLLIEVLPAKWDLLVSTYMWENTKVEEYKFIAFCDAVCAEWERQYGKKILQHMDKLSAVKHKGESPQYKDQKQKSEKQKANDQGDDNHNRKHPTNVVTIKVKGKLLTLITSTPTWPAVALCWWSSPHHQILPQVRFICDHLMCQL